MSSIFSATDRRFLSEDGRDSAVIRWTVSAYAYDYAIKIDPATGRDTEITTDLDINNTNVFWENGDGKFSLESLDTLIRSLILMREAVEAAQSAVTA